MRLTRVPVAGCELHCPEFRRLDTSYGWFHPTAYSDSGGWIGVASDSIPRLIRVPAAGYELRLTPSHGWLEFRWLDKSCGWLHPTADSSFGGWIRIVASSVPRLTRFPAAGYELRLTWVLAAGYDLTLSWRRLLPYRNQSTDVQSKLMDLFLYDNGLRHERVKANSILLLTPSSDWFELRLLDTSCSWFYPVADSSIIL